MAYYSEWMGLYPTQVRITGARTRFGSCSSQGHICFSWRLMQYPPEAIDYVVVHELAHLRYMNHGAEFYALIARYLPPSAPAAAPCCGHENAHRRTGCPPVLLVWN